MTFMNHTVKHLSIAALVLLSLSACGVAPIDEESDGELTDEAAAELSGGPWTWVNTATMRCLDSDGSGAVYTLDCNGGAYQNWTNTPRRFGDQIRNQATGMCLDSNLYNSVYTQTCNGGNFQQWDVVYMGVYGWQIKNVATGYCLDSDGSGYVYTLDCNNGNFQRWH